MDRYMRSPPSAGLLARVDFAMGTCNFQASSVLQEITGPVLSAFTNSWVELFLNINGEEFTGNQAQKPSLVRLTKQQGRSIVYYYRRLILAKRRTISDINFKLLRHGRFGIRPEAHELPAAAGPLLRL